MDFEEEYASSVVEIAKANAPQEMLSVNATVYI
jgi:hypothetical protein